MNTGFTSISQPSLNSLIDVNANSITTSELSLNGVDVTTQLNQVPIINSTNISTL